jgi:predicted Zn-dependent protease
LQAEIEMAAEQYKQALHLYTVATAKFPNSRALQRYHAAALLKTGHAREARDLLKRAVKNQPDDPALQKMLATAAGEAGERMEAHQALATYYYLNGDLRAALEQLRIAQQFTHNSFYLKSSLDARIKEIRKEIAEEKKQ